MKKIITSHVFNTLLIFYFFGMGFLGMVFALYFLVIPLVLVWAFIYGEGESIVQVISSVLVGMGILGALFWVFYRFLGRDFFMFWLFLWRGQTATATITKHHHEKKNNKARSGNIVTTHTYNGQIEFVTASNKNIALKFIVVDPDKERDAIKHRQSVLEVFYLPNRPHVACIAWEGAAKYRKQLNASLWLFLFWFLGFIVFGYDALSAAPLFPKMTIVGYLVFANCFYWIIVWLVMGKLRGRMF